METECDEEKLKMCASGGAGWKAGEKFVCVCVCVCLFVEVLLC